LHNDLPMYKNMCTACLTTGWYDHVKTAMVNQIRENGLKYIKIDLAMITGAYRFDQENFGCFATNHPHKDREESLLMIYQRTWQLFDELHEASPELYNWRNRVLPWNSSSPTTGGCLKSTSKGKVRSKPCRISGFAGC
jgi:hypothetical protein